MRNIAEEIKMYFDNPVSYINMEALEFIYGKHPLGKNVLGTVKSVLSLKQEDFLTLKDVILILITIFLFVWVMLNPKTL